MGWFRGLEPIKNGLLGVSAKGSLTMYYKHKKLWIERLPDWNFAIFDDERKAECIAIGRDLYEAIDSAKRRIDGE